MLNREFERMKVFFSLRWIKNYGKRICILGDRETGKTVIAKFLTTGDFIDEYNSTINVTLEKFRPFKRATRKTDDKKPIEKLPFIIRNILDQTGKKEAYISWKEEYDESDYVIYLFRSYYVTPENLTDFIGRLTDGTYKDMAAFKKFVHDFNDYLKRNEFKDLLPDKPLKDYSQWNDRFIKQKNISIDRIRDDIGQINQWSKGLNESDFTTLTHKDDILQPNSKQKESKKPRKPIVLVGTFGDFIPQFTHYSIERKGVMEGIFTSYLYEKIPGLTPEQKNNVVLCSLASPDEVQRSTKIICQLLKNNQR